ncbi:MAG: GAF domain-containing protein [Symbiobacteriia bacterium]
MSAVSRRESQLQAELELTRTELAQTRRRLQEQVRLARAHALQRDILLSIAQMAASGRPLEETLQALVQYAAALSGAEGAAFGRLYASEDEMELVATWGRLSGSLGEQLALAGSMTREVVRTGVSAVYDRDQPDPNAHPGYLDRFQIRSVMVVPLRVKGHTTGVVWVSNHSPESAAFQAEDVAFLEAFAHQAGLVLSEGLARGELERRVQQLSALKELGLALFRVDQRERLLDLTMERVVQVLDVPMGYIAEADWQAGVYRQVSSLRAAACLPNEAAIDGGSITGRTLLTGRPQVFHHRPPALACDLAGVECPHASFLSVPLPGPNRPIGAVTVAAFTSHRFDEDDLQFLQTVASYLTIAITQSQRLDRLSHELEQLDAVIEQVEAPVLVTDLELRVMRANQAARDLFGVADPFGVSLQELLAGAATLTLEGEPITAVHPALVGACHGRHSKDLLCQVTLRDGSSRWFNVTSTPINDAVGAVRYVVFVGQDITKQRLMERTKDEFLSNVSHELKTPLTAIKGFAQLLTKQAAKAGFSPSVQRALALIDQESNRMTSLVNELLDVSRIQLGRLQLVPSRVDAAELASRAMEQVQQLAPRHKVRLSVPNEPLVGIWDGARLEQVLSNLLDNAVKYQPEGGPIDLALRREGDRLRVEVSDHGVGMDPTAVAQLGRRFYRGGGQLSEEVAGMGLGLYIAAELVRLHGGELNVTSELGEGSRFWFELPLSS